MNHLLSEALLDCISLHCCSWTKPAQPLKSLPEDRSSFPSPVGYILWANPCLPPQKSELSNRQGLTAPCLRCLGSSWRCRWDVGQQRLHDPLCMCAISPHTHPAAQPIFYGLCFVSGCLVLRKEWGFQEERPRGRCVTPFLYTCLFLPSKAQLHTGAQEKTGSD